MRKLIFAAGLMAAATTTAWAGQSLGRDEKYDPKIDPADFTTAIDNPYASMPVGRKLVYEQQTEDGLERIGTLVPGWTKTIMGVETLVSWRREYLDGALIEDVRDYYAQHKNGDVRYFGEHVDVHEDGELADRHGAWIAGPAILAFGGLVLDPAAKDVSRGGKKIQASPGDPELIHTPRGSVHVLKHSGDAIVQSESK